MSVKKVFPLSLLVVDCIWLPHKPSEHLVFLRWPVWLQSISPLPQPHQVAAQLPSVNRTHQDPAVLKAHEGDEVSDGALVQGQKLWAHYRTVSKNTDIQKDQRMALIWKKGSSEYTKCWRSSKILNIVLKYWFETNCQIFFFFLSLVNSLWSCHFSPK